ncbi:hypothetical protein LQL77_31660 [Rhodococcus cerastii]|nr:hypothetical protein [Rhodococcus cerastii]
MSSSLTPDSSDSNLSAPGPERLIALSKTRDHAKSVVEQVTTDVVGVLDYRHGRVQFSSSSSVTLAQRRLTDPTAVIAGLPVDSRPAPTGRSHDALLWMLQDIHLG